MTETLRIDTGLVLEAGGRLQGIAGAIPPPPAAFSPTGADALSTAIAAKVAEVVDPVIAQLPVTKADLTRYAQNVVNAANTYDAVDRQIAEEILKRLQELDANAAGAGSAAGGASSAGEASATGAVHASQAPGAGQQAGQLGQMMQVPMQPAQQAAQIPMQLAGTAASIPAGMMQGVQSAMQSVGQAPQMSGDEKPEERDGDAAQVDRPAEAQQKTATPVQAAPGDGAGERVPEHPSPAPQPAPRPAPTRPAESPEIAL